MDGGAEWRCASTARSPPALTRAAHEAHQRPAHACIAHRATRAPSYTVPIGVVCRKPVIERRAASRISAVSRLARTICSITAIGLAARLRTPAPASPAEAPRASRGPAAPAATAATALEHGDSPPSPEIRPPRRHLGLMLEELIGREEHPWIRRRIHRAELPVKGAQTHRIAQRHRAMPVQRIDRGDGRAHEFHRVVNGSHQRGQIVYRGMSSRVNRPRIDCTAESSCTSSTRDSSRRSSSG